MSPWDSPRISNKPVFFLCSRVKPIPSKNNRMVRCSCTSPSINPRSVGLKVSTACINSNIYWPLLKETVNETLTTWITLTRRSTELESSRLCCNTVRKVHIARPSNSSIRQSWLWNGPIAFDPGEGIHESTSTASYVEVITIEQPLRR